MITKSSLPKLLENLGFERQGSLLVKDFPHFHCQMKVDLVNEKLIYPENILGRDRNTGFDKPENFVVFECVNRLLVKGYRPETIELEKVWTLGHEQKSGRADIIVYTLERDSVLFILECKTAGSEFTKAVKQTKEDGGQVFSYWQQERTAKWLGIYTSDFKDQELSNECLVINCSDDANIVKLAKKDESVLIYSNPKVAGNAHNLFEVWTETYKQEMHDNIIFDDETVAYKIGVKPLRKKNLRDFTPNDKIVNRFEEILRHNNVSDKENAFNRLIALFICKLVDELSKGEDDIVDFQYRIGTDDYETLQDRLQRLHKQGMEDFMKEEIFYVPNDYAEKLFIQYTGQKREQAIENLKNTIRVLKFYSNNDFAFKDVHNEELFFQNGKILVEVVQLFERYRIVYPSKYQFLGDLFEQLLNKGFKQNEGQFFTPMPITRFIWDSLPIERIVTREDRHIMPKVIDYACGAGHFLTEAIEAVNAYFNHIGKPEMIENNGWVEKSIYGVEKDYRLARVSKVSLFMNGAGQARIIFGDGLECYPEKGIENGKFDVLVANPPYSVDAFKSHLALKNNQFEILEYITNNGSEIETLFVERIAQLLKPRGIAAVVLPSSILSNSNPTSYMKAREHILKNFFIRSIVCFGGKTFGATSTSTITLFLEKFDEPPTRYKLVEDSVSAILSGTRLSNWEDQDILDSYLAQIGIEEDVFRSFISQQSHYSEFKDVEYFNNYIVAFEKSSAVFNRKKTKTFKKMSEADQALTLNSMFYDYVIPIEKDKIFFFGLVRTQSTLVITAPSDNADQKAFLGYEWSNRKGSEGIVITNPGGKLYNDGNRYAPGTVAHAVKLAYEGATVHSDALEGIAQYFLLKDMLDFSRATFDKSIRTTAKKAITIKSKFPILKLGKFVGEDSIQKGTAITKSETIPGDFKVVAGGISYAYTNNIYNREANVITISASGANAGFVNFWAERIYASDCITIFTDDVIKTKYIYYFLKANQDLLYSVRPQQAGQPHFYRDDLLQFPIPEIPSDIQKKVVEECEEIEKEYERTRMTIEDYRSKILQLFDTLNVISGGVIRKVGDIGQIKMCKRVMKHQTAPTGDVPFFKIGTFGGTPDAFISRTLFEDFKNKYPYPKKGQVLLSAAGTIGKSIVFDGNDAYFQDSNIVWIDTNNKIVNNDFIHYCFKYVVDWDKYKTDGSVISRLYNDDVKEIEIPFPSFADQNRIASEIKELETKISALEKDLTLTELKKKDIVAHYIS